MLCVLNENRKYFAQADGLRLLQLIIKCAFSEFVILVNVARNKRFARKGALKLLDYVLQDDAKNCRRWVLLPALGTLFAAFMKKGSKRHKKGFDELADDGMSMVFVSNETLRAITEHIMSIIASLFKCLEGSEEKLVYAS